MGFLKNKQKDVMGSLASIITLLERYPTLTTTDNMLSSFSLNTSIGFLLSLLEMFGVGQRDLIKWLAKILQGTSTDGSDGLLNVIEHAIKATLLANVKDMFTCSINPIIPDCLLRYSYINNTDPYSSLVNNKNYKEITLRLNEIDPFGQLNNSPISEYGKLFYFDSAERIYENGDIKSLNQNELWQSCDFNAFMWYVINKGDITNLGDKKKTTWDNRISYTSQFNNDTNLYKNFFNVEKNEMKSTQTAISIDGGTFKDIKKKPIIICQYVEHATPVNGKPSSNQLRIWLSADRYYKKKKIGNNITYNSTIFEFNYDYIYSLKLFDTKTLIAQITNSLLGLASSLSVSVSVESQMVKGKLSQIVKKIISADDTSTSDCYFTFSNDEHNQMIEDAMKTYNGQYTVPNGTNINIDINDLIKSISKVTRNCDITTIEKTLEDISVIAGEQTRLNENIEFTVGTNFIKDFLEQTITEIVLQLLSPKLLILYKINAIVMGTAVDDMDTYKDLSIDGMLKGMYNLIVNIIKTVKDILIEQLYNFMMEQLKPLIQLLISKLALEVIKYYKDLITQLILACLPSLDGNSIWSTNNTIINSVDYADIVPTQTSPTQTESKNKNC